MRGIVIGLLAAGAVASACNRANPASAATVAQPAEAAATNAAATPLPTAGTPRTAATVSAAAPAVREITLPVGTHLPIVLETPVGSDVSRVEEPVRARLTRAVVVGGVTVLPEGSAVSGVVTDATRSGRVKGRAHLAMRFDSVTPRGEEGRYQIRTQPVARMAPGTKKKDALEIGAPAAGGAIIGGLLGGKKGALIGTAVGGGAGTGVVLSTRGKEVQVPKGTVFVLKLTSPLTVRVRG